MNKLWTSKAWSDYIYWQATDKRILAKINQLLKNIERTPFEGEGLPEPLGYSFSGYWSRRINQEHRLIYKVEENTILIIQCRYHYKK